MTIMVEAACDRHRVFQRILPRRAEGRMADIVRQAQSFGQILVKPKRARDAAADLRNLDTVGQANAIMVAVGGDEHLRLVTEAAKGDRMDDAVAVALEIVARAANAATGIWMAEAGGVFRAAGAVSEYADPHCGVALARGLGGTR